MQLERGGKPGFPYCVYRMLSCFYEVERSPLALDLFKNEGITLVLGERVPFATLFKPTTGAPAMSPLPFGKRIAARVRQASDDFLLFRGQICPSANGHSIASGAPRTSSNVNFFLHDTVIIYAVLRIV